MTTDLFNRIAQIIAELDYLRAELQRIAAEYSQPVKPIARTIQDGMNTIPRTACLLNPRPEDDPGEKKEST